MKIKTVRQTIWIILINRKKNKDQKKTKILKGIQRILLIEEPVYLHIFGLSNKTVFLTQILY